MLLVYTKPKKVDPTIVWSKLEDIFEYMSQNGIEKVYFSPTDDFSTGFNGKDFQTFSRELFDSIKKLAHSKFWFDSGAFETIVISHNGQNYRIEVFESHPDPMNAYSTIHTITITC